MPKSNDSKASAKVYMSKSGKYVTSQHRYLDSFVPTVYVYAGTVPSIYPAGFPTNLFV